MLKLNLSRLSQPMAVLCLLFLFSCKKDIKTPEPPVYHDNIVKGTDGIPAVPFSWWTVDVMPVPASYTGPTIYVPWGQGAVKGFSSDIWYDMQPGDGWVMVYNEFNTTESSLPANPFFILYNQYRGTLRIYEYVTTNGFQNSDYLTSGLNLSPNSVNSSLLNFIGKDIIDVSNPSAIITKIEPTQIATNAWYACQYEMAYDPNIANSTFQQIGINWTLKWTNITQVSLGGTAVGTLNGSITTPASSGFSLSGLISNAETGALEATGLAVFNNNKGNNGVNNGLGLPANIFNAAQSGLSSGLSGVVKNIFSGIFGGSSSGSTQSVNLTLNATINLTGSTTGSGALIPDPGLGLGVPGTSNSQSAQGLIPYYNSPLGVFNLSGRPSVDMTTTSVSDGTEEGSSTTYTFAIDDNSFQKIFNPVVTNNAQIQNYFEEIMLPNMTSDQLNRGASEIGEDEQIGSIPAIGDVWYINVQDGIGPPLEVLVRIQFDVVPNNGAPRSKIVKTFLANIVNQ